MSQFSYLPLNWFALINKFEFEADVYIVFFTIVGCLTMELAHGWKLYDYISYQKYRFSVREVRWQISAADTLDESIAEPLQSLDMMCFSSQFYFMTSLMAYGALMSMFGITIQLRYNFNMFADQAFPLIFAIVFLVSNMINYMSRILADLGGLWMRKNLEGTVDDDIAAKLAVGEGNQADLEAERLEMQAMNSERFRHRFLVLGP